MQGLPAAPAADEVQQGVDPAKALKQRRTPFPRRRLVKQVDCPSVQRSGGKPQPGPNLVDPLLRDISPSDRGTRLGQPLGHHGP